MIGFVYIWRDRKHNRYYVGSHWGRIDDGYVCSSAWMKRAYRLRPEDFKRRILETVDDRSTLTEREHRWLQMMKKGELKTKYYNLRNHHFGHWTANEESILTVGQKISKANTGKKQNLDPEVKAKKNERISKSNRGKKRTPEMVEAMKERLRGQKQSEETRRKRAESMRKAWENRPRTFSEEARENMRRGHLGVKLSPEHVAKRAAAQTGLKRSQETIDRMKATLARKREERTAT